MSCRGLFFVGVRSLYIRSLFSKKKKKVAACILNCDSAPAPCRRMMVTATAATRSSMTPERADKPFKPSRAVVLSELEEDEKDAYLKLILDSRIKIHYDPRSLGHFVANVRLHGSPVVGDAGLDVTHEEADDAEVDTDADDEAEAGEGEGEGEGDLSEPFRLQDGAPEATVQPAEEADTNTADSAEAAVYAPYRRFCVLITNDTLAGSGAGAALEPRARPLAWLLKLAEELYDARFAHETAEAAKAADAAAAEAAGAPAAGPGSPPQGPPMRTREQGPPTPSELVRLEERRQRHVQAAHSQPAQPPAWEGSGASCFPAYVARRLVTTIGIKSLVDQTGWEIVLALTRYARIGPPGNSGTQ